MQSIMSCPYSSVFQFKMWSTADDSLICRFTSDAKDKPMGEFWKKKYRVYMLPQLEHSEFKQIKFFQEFFHFNLTFPPAKYTGLWMT